MKRIMVEDIKPGVFVCALDRPWLETPFLFQGFLVRSEDEINTAKKHCNYVYIDPERGIDVASGTTISNSTPISQHEIENTGHIVRIEEEIEQAKETYQKTETILANVMTDVAHGRALSMPGVQDCVTDIVASVSRNADAFTWLTRLKQTDNYSYSHALDVAVYMICLGRQLGFPKEQLEFLGVAGLLQDVGKLKLPKELLQKTTELTDTERELIRNHLNYGLQLISESNDVPSIVLTIIGMHHERVDGSGYPNHLRGREISVFGGIAGLADCYDALTSDRPYAKAASPFSALRVLKKLEGQAFQDSLIEQFIQSMGIYPAGSVVELSSGEVAIIVEQNKIRRLKPKVMLILDENKQPYQTMQMLNLLHDPIGINGKALEIKRALEPGEFAIDPKDYFL